MRLSRVLFLSFHLSLDSPSELARLIRSLTPTLRAASSSRAVYQSQRLPTFRATATCSGGQPDPLGIIPFRWSYCIILGWVCQGFFEDFFRGSSNLVLGYKRIARLGLRHFGVPLLGYDPWPSEGLGFASPPDIVIIAQSVLYVNTFLKKIFAFIL